MDWYEVTGNRSRIRRVLRFFEEQNFFVVRAGPNKFYTHVHPELSNMIKDFGLDCMLLDSPTAQSISYDKAPCGIMTTNSRSHSGGCKNCKKLRQGKQGIIVHATVKDQNIRPPLVLDISESPNLSFVSNEYIMSELENLRHLAFDLSRKLDEMLKLLKSLYILNRNMENKISMAVSKEANKNS